MFVFCFFVFLKLCNLRIPSLVSNEVVERNGRRKLALLSSAKRQGMTSMEYLSNMGYMLGFDRGPVRRAVFGIQ